ncbi:MAG TPA: hypothetical protein VMX57_00500, partial [Planctomycetota bacterium]|nr:hypothetical protein [Planctomycetota bacterium]
MGAPRQVTFVVAATLLSLVTATFAQAPPASFEAALPEGVHATFLVRFDKALPEAARRALHFDVDRDGNPVLLAGNTLVVPGDAPDAPVETLEVAGVERVDAFACMTDGTMLVVSGRDLGQLTDTGFQKMLTLPAEHMRVAPASREACYLLGGDTPDARRDVWLYEKGGKLLHLVRAESPVTAVAGAGEATFFAVGNSVFLHVRSKDLPGTLRLVHTADDAVTALALSPPSGVFCATAKGVAYVAGPGSGFTFLRGKGARLSTHGETLYLFFGDEGVMRCSPVTLFEKMNHDLAMRNTDGGVKLTATGRRAIEQGLQAVTVNDWEAAIRHFDTARADAPYAPEVLYNLGLACDRSGSRDVLAIVW